MDSADKATNKAMSAAWKYAAILAFNIRSKAYRRRRHDPPHEASPPIP